MINQTTSPKSTTQFLQLIEDQIEEEFLSSELFWESNLYPLNIDKNFHSHFPNDPERLLFNSDHPVPFKLFSDFGSEEEKKEETLEKEMTETLVNSTVDES